MKNQRILDLGCGKGQYGWLLKSEGENCFLVGVDVHKPYLLRLKRLYDCLIVADVNHLPFVGKQVFNVVLCLDVLEHLTKVQGRKLIQTCKRLGTKIVLTTPNVWFRQHLECNPFQKHKCLWKPLELKKLGFQVFGVGSKVKPQILLQGIAFYFPVLARQLLAVYNG